MIQRIFKLTEFNISAATYNALHIAKRCCVILEPNQKERLIAMANFIRKKNAAISYINSCIGFTKAHGYFEQTKKLTDILDELSSGKVVIAVVGEARRGKSTLLSSLLEDTELFPVNVDVTTCTVTTVTYGEAEKITVTFNDNSQKVISRAEISQYADESSNKGNAMEVKWIEIETPNENLKEGVTFVDTPGVGSVNPLHTEAVLGFLPYAKAVLFVTDAFQPITETELDFLRGVKRHCDNFIFVLTKTDAVSEYEQIAESNKQKICEYAGIEKDNIVYIAVSAELKLAGLTESDAGLIEASNITALEDAIWSNVEKNQEDHLLVPPMNAVAGVLNIITEDLRVKSAALFGRTADQQQISAEYQDKLEKINRFQNDFRLWDRVIKDESENTANRFQQKINDFKSEMDHQIDDIALSKKKQEPAKVLNTFIMSVGEAKEELTQIMADGIFTAVVRLEKETGFDLSTGLSSFALSERAVPALKLKKAGLTGTLIGTGTRSLMGGAGGAAVGAFLGKLIGGAIGGTAGSVVVPGVGTFYGAAGGAAVGAAIGLKFGTALGTAWGAMRGLKDVNAQTIPQIQMQIRTYINSTVNAWNSEYRRYAPVFRKLGESLSDEFIRMKNNTAQEMNDIKQLIVTDEASKAKATVKFKAISTDLNTLQKGFNEVLN